MKEIPEREREREREYMFVQVCVHLFLVLYSNLVTFSYNAHCVKLTYSWTRMCGMHHVMQLTLFCAMTHLTYIFMAVLHTSFNILALCDLHITLRMYVCIKEWFMIH
jgi:hypothetical protein